MVLNNFKLLFIIIKTYIYIELYHRYNLVQAQKNATRDSAAMTTQPP